MGVFDLFRTKKSDVVSPNQHRDERKAECPYCHKVLTKVPGRKTKCPYCGEFMFIRTRPMVNARVVVTKNEADKIDEEWSIIAGTHDIFVAEKEEFAKQKELLKNRFGGKEPSDNDVRWGLLNKQLIEHAQNADWGLYRNARFQMAEVLRGEMRLKAALQTYLEVCYLDLNGPNNRGGMSDPELLKEFPPFNPNEDAFLAPGVIDLIQRIIRKLDLNEEEVKQIYIQHNLRIGKALKLPLAVEQCWIPLSRELYPTGVQSD